MVQHSPVDIPLGIVSNADCIAELTISHRTELCTACSYTTKESEFNYYLGLVIRYWLEHIPACRPRDFLYGNELSSSSSLQDDSTRSCWPCALDVDPKVQSQIGHLPR